MKILIVSFLVMLSTTSFASEYLCNIMSNASNSNIIMTTQDLLPSLLIPVKNKDGLIQQRLMELDKLENGGVMITISEGINGRTIAQHTIASKDNGIYLLQVENEVSAVCQSTTNN